MNVDPAQPDRGTGDRGVTSARSPCPLGLAALGNGADVHVPVAAPVVASLKGARVLRAHAVTPAVHASSLTRALMFEREMKEAT
jgi:hypothetical protein